jgi:hypothetical protein
VTRATLLHVLDRPTALGPAEVRELEQLAQAFPYCQTAHLLLAKAAHDQGTMLAGQRLRRAATYAADRTLLRRLIEQVEPAVTEPEVDVQGEAIAPELPTAALAAPAPAPAAETTVPVATVVLEPATPAVSILPAADSEVLGLTLPDAVEPTPSAPAPILPAQVAAKPEAEVAPEAPQAPVPAAAAAAAPILLLTEAEPVMEPVSMAALPATETDFPALVDHEGVEIPTAAVAVADVEPTPELEEDLPAQAPAIRPPVEVGEARFEFGLAPAPPPTAPTYELPGLVDEWAASAVTRSMGSPELLRTPPNAPDTEAPAVPVLTPAAFTGDATVGYGFGESSRLGFSMQLLDLLAAQAEAPECTTAQVAAAQPPATALPPAGTFFEPDPLLLDHWATHCPPAPSLPSSLDLINNFLRRQPRLSRPAMLPPSPAAQADLSVRSTRAEPDLASESLARILVRQGKTARAIEIYEKLMVKQPEKMAYFAAQIQSLQPPA